MALKPQNFPSSEKLAYSVAEAMHATGLGKNKIYDEISNGRLVAKKVGGRTIIAASAIGEWLDRLPDLEPGAASKPRKAA
jgi:excisionase family DNA binding protein